MRTRRGLGRWAAAFWVVGRAGDRIELSQTRPSDAAGTFDEPYFASGLVFGDCYPVLLR